MVSFTNKKMCWISRNFEEILDIEDINNAIEKNYQERVRSKFHELS